MSTTLDIVNNITNLSNFKTLKALKRAAIVSELEEKSRGCSVQWTQLSNTQFQATVDPYDFYITQTTPDTCVLDVLKNGAPYRSYNSVEHPEVQDLYNFVNDTVVQSYIRNNITNVVGTLSKVTGPCAGTHYNFGPTGGVWLNGNPDKFVLIPTTVFMLPGALAFDNNLSYPWTGTVDDINDLPDAVHNDGDASYIWQKVAPTLTAQSWGYAYVAFGYPTLPDTGPYTARVRVAHKHAQSTTTDVPSLNVDILVNASVYFSDQMVCSDTYQIYDSGAIPINFSSVSRIVVRLSMYTDGRDITPLTLQVSAVDLTVTGYNRFDDGQQVARYEQPFGAVAGSAVVA